MARFERGKSKYEIHQYGHAVGVRGPITAHVRQNAKPVVHVVNSLATTAVSIKRLRGWLAVDLRVYIEADVVVAARESKLRRFLLRPSAGEALIAPNNNTTRESSSFQ